jgi:hypothetical protein
MTDKSNGGSAFPSGQQAGHSVGMSLRDWFAGMAMQGFLAAHTGPMGVYGTTGLLAQNAYLLADAMLARRGGG